MRIQNINSQQYKTQKYNQTNKQNNTETLYNQNFRSKFWDKIGKAYGEKYANKMLDQDWMHTLSSNLAGASKLMTEHMATLGSLLTSSVYFYQTVTNKKLDADKRTTLGINQIGCFAIPTVCAYGVNYKLQNFNKSIEYRYSGLKRQQMALGQLSPEKYEKLTKSLGAKLKCFGALMGLLTFTTIYRFITPVGITPLANWAGDKYLAWKKTKKQNANNKEFNQDNISGAKGIALEPNVKKAKEIELNPTKEYKQSA